MELAVLLAGEFMSKAVKADDSYYVVGVQNEHDLISAWYSRDAEISNGDTRAINVYGWAVQLDTVIHTQTKRACLDVRGFRQQLEGILGGEI